MDAYLSRLKAKQRNDQPLHTCARRRARSGEIWSYVKAQADECIADRIQAAIKSRFALLADNPGAGHWRRDLTHQDVKFFPVFSYLIVYRPATKPLQVVSILHGRRDVERILRERR